MNLYYINSGLKTDKSAVCVACGASVKSERIRIMNVKLGNLKSGEYRVIQDVELYKASGSFGCR